MGYGYGVSLSSVGIFHIVSIDFLHNRTQSSPNRPTDRPNARVQNGFSVQSAGKMAKRALKAWVFINEKEEKKTNQTNNTISAQRMDSIELPEFDLLKTTKWILIPERFCHLDTHRINEA